MSETAIRERVDKVRSLEAERLELRDDIRKARKAGASIKDLMAWTGYSKRNIQYMLKEQS